MALARSLLALVLISLPALAQPAVEVERVVRDFHAAHAAGKVAVAAGFWTSSSAPLFAARASRSFHTRCHVVHDFAVKGVHVDADSATAETETRVTRWSAMAGAMMETEVQRVTLTLRRENGAWKIDSWRTAEEHLADRLLAQSSDDRDALLRENAPLRNRSLVEALCRRAIVFVNQAKPAQAAEAAGVARAIARELDEGSLATVLTAESVLLRRQPYYDIARALETVQQAVDIAETTGDADTLARALVALARAKFDARAGGDRSAAQRALALAEFVEEASVLAHAASRLAQSLDDNWHRRAALRYAKLAARYAEESGDPSAMIAAWMNLTGSYEYHNDFSLAAPYAHKALALAEREGFVEVRAGLMDNLAVYAWLNGDVEEALRITDRALALLGSDGYVGERAGILKRQANFHLARGNVSAAAAAVDEAMRLLKTARFPDYKVTNALARVRYHQGRYEEAMTIAQQLRAEGHSDPGLEADIFEAQGKLVEARALREDVLTAVEGFRREFADERHRSLAFDSTSVVRLVESYAGTGEARNALATAERLKARLLRELMAERVDTSTAEEPLIARLNAEVVELNRRLVTIQRDGGDTADIRAELRRARGRLEEALMSREHPRAPALILPAIDPASLRAPAGMTVVEYVVGDERVTAFVIRGGDVRVHSLDIGRRDLRSLVNELVGAIELRDGKYRAAARRAYDVLLRPLIGEDPREEMLCIIPDESLWTLPFQALVTAGGKHLIERTPMFYAPSLTLLSPATPERNAPPTVLAFGDPALDVDTRHEIRADYRDATLGRLPDADVELTAMQRLYGPRIDVRLGPVARESALKRTAGRYDVLHFATHGLLEDKSPMYSALLLAGSESDDGLLETREIITLPLDQADLVVLSACNSARGQVTGSEGVVGLSWAFLAAGCPRVVATQWRVGSASAASLMIGFHERMSKRKAVTNVAHALRDAQLEMLRKPQYAHPYYWAGFVLIGRDH